MKKYHGGVKGVPQKPMQEDVGYAAKGGKFGKYPDTMQELDAFGRASAKKLESQAKNKK